jgi:predicted RND superfamily exporter protein
MVAGTALWTLSSIRFNAVMGGLLAIWMFVSFVASETLLPVLISYLRPKFIMKEAARYKEPSVQPGAGAVAVS